MDALVVPAAAEPQRLLRVANSRPFSAWVLSFAVVVYLGTAGGGYSLAVHSRVGIVVWWIVVVSAAWGLLPVTRTSRSGALCLAFLGGFTAWTALGITWSISSGRSWQDLSLITCYLGIFVLALAIHRDRSEAVRHTVGAVASGIVVLAAVAVAARLWPDLFAGSRSLNQFTTITTRLAWPINYWNGLAALMVIGLPLLLGLMTSARTLRAQAAAAAGVPVVVLCGSLTLSRGGLIAGAAALIVFVALAPERIPKLAGAAFAAAGSAALVAGAFHRHALQQGLASAAEHRQAGSMVVAIVLVCAGVAVAQAGVGLLTRHATPPRLLSISAQRARILLGMGIALVIVVGLIINVPGKIDHVWHDFQNPKGLTGQVANSSSRLTNASGEGRYQYWVAGIDAAQGHVLNGSGPGTFQDLWLPRAKIVSYVTNAHSLYVETYAELGLVGLALLVGFFAVVLIATIAAVIRTRDADRTRAAAVAASLVAFVVFAGFDWIWQIPVIPACVLLLTAAILAPIGASGSGRAPRRLGSVVTTLLGLGCLFSIAYPLATNNAIARSEAAFNGHRPISALSDARTAVAIEPGSAEAQLQLALVLENQHQLGAALAAARRAVADESQNWTNWLTLSRLEIEAGHPGVGLADYRHARALNPESDLFHS